MDMVTLPYLEGGGSSFFHHIQMDLLCGSSTISDYGNVGFGGEIATPTQGGKVITWFVGTYPLSTPLSGHVLSQTMQTIVLHFNA